MSHIKKMLGILLAWLALTAAASASELDLVLPVLNGSQTQLLTYGLLVCLAGLLFGVFDANAIRRLPAHRKMLDISQLIFAGYIDKLECSQSRKYFDHMAQTCRNSIFYFKPTLQK
jgi:hypothetical protein